jgi:predicted ABC-type ATPase
VVAAVPLCRRAVFWDNSTDDGPIEVAALRSALPDYPPRWPTWTPEVLLGL